MKGMFEYTGPTDGAEPFRLEVEASDEQVAQFGRDVALRKAFIARWKQRVRVDLCLNDWRLLEETMG